MNIAKSKREYNKKTSPSAKVKVPATPPATARAVATGRAQSRDSCAGYTIISTTYVSSFH